MTMDAGFMLKWFSFACVLNRNVYAGSDYNVTRENIALNKTTAQSFDTYSRGYYWKSAYAVDGSKNYSIDCKCCSSAQRQSSWPWWYVDLGSTYDIGKINIYGRLDTDSETGKFIVRAGIDASSLEWIKTNDVVGNTYKNSLGLISIPLGKLNVRYIHIQNQLDYLTLCEVEIYVACEDNRFEPNCEECGHCDGSQCDKATGVCPSGCKAGWKGTACNETCEPGFYGNSCAQECRCRNHLDCDSVTGKCLNGQCNYMWTGEYCNVSTSISLGKSVRMVSQFDSWEAKLAVDGNLTTDADKCKCCAATDNADYPWFEVDLGKAYRIAYITIYGRTDKRPNGQDFRSLKMYASQYVSKQKLPVPFYENYGYTFFLNIKLHEPIITQYVSVLLDEYSRLLVICELQLFKGECNNGTFGEFCDNKCYCEGETCDGESGICPSGKCLLGYQGANCDQECDNGTFGRGCTDTCGFCVNGSVCNKVNGSCSGCSPGYEGAVCKTACPAGAFGDQCLSTCGHCLNGQSCDHVTGRCVHGCHPGFVRPLCNETCQKKTFGMDCKETCGKCFNNETCNITNGHCSKEGCIEDFIPPLCSMRRQELSGESLPVSAGALGGIVSAVLVVLLVVVVLAVLVKRRRSKNDAISVEQAKKHREDNTQDSVLANVQTKSDSDKKAKVLVVKPTVRDPEVKKTEAVQISQEPMEYYAFVPRKEDVKIHQIWDYIHKGLEDDCSIFFAEFKSFKKGLQHECKAAQKEDNKLKHRYKEIYAYDHNRVHLTSENSHEEELYINASFIDGYEKVAKFIASQGPTQDMVNDFYTMIWQQNCSIIVMLTNVFELGVLKCLQYWPFDDEVTFGIFTIRVQKEDIFPDYVIRHLEINKDGDGTRVVKQYHFTSWPDKTVPQTVWSLVHFWRIVDKESKTQSQHSPILVHCSAGVGRTGTFIALDNLYHQAMSEGCIRPVPMVETLRRQRVNMIQTKTQYVFMHEAVAEALMFGTHYVLSSQFEDVFKFLSNQTDDGTVTNMEIQYEILEKSLDDNLVVSHGELTTNNTISEDNEDVLEAVYNNDDSAAMLNEREVQTDAVYGNVKETVQPNDKRRPLLHFFSVQDYKNEDSFLVVDEPTNDDMIREFWSFVTASGAKTVVHIKVSENNLLNDQSTVNKQEHSEDCVMTDIIFCQLDKNGFPAKIDIRLFEYSGWKEGENVISDQQSLMRLLTDIQLWQTTLSNMEPIVIVKNSSKQAGIVCVLLNELSRIKTLEQINILETVKMMKHKDRELISSFEQYRYCHEVILLSLQDDSIYQNV